VHLAPWPLSSPTLPCPNTLSSLFFRPFRPLFSQRRKNFMIFLGRVVLPPHVCVSELTVRPFFFFFYCLWNRPEPWIATVSRPYKFLTRDSLLFLLFSPELFFLPKLVQTQLWVQCFYIVFSFHFPPRFFPFLLSPCPVLSVASLAFTPLTRSFIFGRVKRQPFDLPSLAPPRPLCTRLSLSNVPLFGFFRVKNPPYFTFILVPPIQNLAPVFFALRVHD